jgi:myo-inositol 2-dehydrogenase / D-chiro-inositol 1-dehydrogenase
VASDPLRLALIGLGRMGRFHLRALTGTGAVEVVALAEPVPSALAEGLRLAPDAACYTDVAAALAHPELEACLIATPTPTHPQIVRAAIDAGLHVLCEKPLAFDAAEALRLGRLAAERGLVLQIGFWRRFSPPWRAAKAALEAGQIGTPLLVRLCQWDASPPPATFCDPAVSGGLAIDCGVHEFDLAEWLTGSRIVRVAAWSLPVVDAAVGAAGDVDNLVAVLELDGGGVATVDLSRNARYGDDVRTEILGSAGALFVDLLPTGRTRLGTDAGVELIAGSTAEDATAAGVVAQAAAFASRVRGEETGGPDALASVRATQVGQAVTEAARTGAPVVLDAEQLAGR